MVCEGEKATRSSRPARRVVRYVILALAVVSAVAFVGFLRFADQVAALQPPIHPKADAIVVLTGSAQRIGQGLELLKSGAGQRLLISGVHPTTSGNQIRKLNQSSSTLFECCVDIGHDAIDTIGNANETARWISDHGYRSILVVTNNYHMPRSLLELKRSDNRTEFISYPVVSADLKSGYWLAKRAVVRPMISEYIKYTAATLRDMAGAGSSKGLRGDVALDNRAQENDGGEFSMAK
ncbi:YdcF family protein [Sinorhizobium sp. BG8]|nr:YdcF family protein [Sinorhizobium sp. BG8]